MERWADGQMGGWSDGCKASLVTADRSKIERKKERKKERKPMAKN